MTVSAPPATAPSIPRLSWSLPMQGPFSTTIQLKPSRGRLPSLTVNPSTTPRLERSCGRPREGIDMDGTQVVAIAAFLRVINVLENIRQSIELLEPVTQKASRARNRSSDRSAVGPGNARQHPGPVRGRAPSAGGSASRGSPAADTEGRARHLIPEQTSQGSDQAAGKSARRTGRNLMTP